MLCKCKFSCFFFAFCLTWQKFMPSIRRQNAAYREWFSLSFYRKLGKGNAWRRRCESSLWCQLDICVVSLSPSYRRLSTSTCTTSSSVFFSLLFLLNYLRPTWRMRLTNSYRYAYVMLTQRFSITCMLNSFSTLKIDKTSYCSCTPS